jgi:hypothetical protein
MLVPNLKDGSFRYFQVLVKHPISATIPASNNNHSSAR